MCGQVNNKARQGKGVLTDEQVREVRKAKELYYENMPVNLCKKYGVSRSVISQIWQDRSYSHVLD